MRAGTKQFWASFLITLGVLLPLTWCSLLWYDTTRQSAPTARDESSLPIAAGSRESLHLLAAVAPAAPGQQPHLALVGLDGPGCRITVCALPGDTSLLTPDGGSVTLAESYLAAGPARAAQLLGDTLDISIPLYLAATPAGWDLLLGRTARLDTSSLLTDAQRRRLGLENAVTELSVAAAAALLEESLPAREKEALETALWDAFARQSREGLGALPDAIRTQSSRLLTSLGATELLRLDKLLPYLAGAEAAVTTLTVPGSRAGSLYLLNEESLAFAAGLPG